MEDNLITEVKEYQIRSYEDLSSEFQRLYPRVADLIQLMYNRLTLVDKLSHKEAVAKIYNDHQHLSGFSRRRRNLPTQPFQEELGHHGLKTVLLKLQIHQN